MIYLLFSLLAASATFADSPIRDGLGFKDSAAPQFTDAKILSSIQYAVENSQLAPVNRIRLETGTESLTVTVVSDKEQSKPFTFRIENGQPVAKEAATASYTQHIEIPFGTLQTFGFEQKPGFDYSGTAAWVAVGVVGVYAAKKLLNKMTIGKFSASEDHDHESLFPGSAQMRAEMAANRELAQKALAKAEEALDGQLLEIAKPLVQAAACGHDHSGAHVHTLGHKHDDTGYKCEAVGEPEVKAAQKSLLTAFPNYAARFGKDFYKELIEPVVGLIKAVQDKNTRKQIWNFFDLISRRMIQERGVAAAVVTGAFVGAGQLIIEVLESFVMPAGAHMFCQVGNAAVLAVAAKAYTTYFCMTQNAEFENKTLADRWRTAQRISKLSKASAEPDSGDEKIIHALNLLFRLVERDVRHARNLDDLGKPESRELARRLGILRRELTVLSIRLINKTSEDGEALMWLKDLYGVQSVLQDPQACADLLKPAA